MLQPSVQNTAVVVDELTFHKEGTKGPDAVQVEERYGKERAKRLRNEGTEQFVDISLSDKFEHFQEDVWVDPAAVKDIRTQFPSNTSSGSCRVLVLGAGWAGLLYAVRMVDSGVPPQDVRIVDTAGGFGGTWYWNRYPGVACDIESYCYLALLEETGYVPQHRYSYGEEIRNYMNLIAEKWGLADSGVFQTRAQQLEWDDTSKEWLVELLQQRTGEPSLKLGVSSQFVVMASGVVNWPKLPGVPGILNFPGEIFHTSRWNYPLTGGSPADPSLTKLQDKRVAIIGTGATAVQAIPHLARWSKHLYVVQRTPSHIDQRDQRRTDLEEYHKSVANAQGWQRERLKNFHQQFTIKAKPSFNLVDDGWTHVPGVVELVGHAYGPRSAEEVPDYIKQLRALDLPRSNRIRARAAQVVKDPDTAKKLQAWYPSWCKRPCFHDEYLPSFNRKNVTLIDTDGKGLAGVVGDSIVAGDQSFPVDIIVFATGFRPHFEGTPADRANVTVLGRNGVSMADAWARDGPSTLHGVLDHNFPNLLLAGQWQAATSPSYSAAMDSLAKHSAHITAEASRRAAGRPFAVAPTADAAADWAAQVKSRAIAMAASGGCTPSYYNAEGKLDKMSPEEYARFTRGTIWGHGYEDFVARLERWRATGEMQGIEVRT